MSANRKEPLARISAAIEKLERLKLNATLDEWVIAPSGIDNVRGVIAVYDRNLKPSNADLIVTLHRTIDAQIEILRAVKRQTENRMLETTLATLGLRLADSILGGK